MPPRLHLDVEVELLVELSFDGALPAERAQPEPEVAAAHQSARSVVIGSSRAARSAGMLDAIRHAITTTSAPAT